MCFDNSSGIIKGEQPLIRASRASKVAGAFLVLFWHAKENISLNEKAICPAHRRVKPLPFLLFLRSAALQQVSTAISNNEV